MIDIGFGVVLAGITGAFGVERREVGLELGILDVDPTGCCVT